MQLNFVGKITRFRKSKSSIHLFIFIVLIKNLILHHLKSKSVITEPIHPRNECFQESIKVVAKVIQISKTTLKYFSDHLEKWS